MKVNLICRGRSVGKPSLAQTVKWVGECDGLELYELDKIGEVLVGDGV